MGVPVIAFGRKEEVDYITLGPTKETYEKAVRPLICKNCGAPLTRGLNKCEYCGTVYFTTANLLKGVSHDQKETEKENQKATE